MFRSAFAVLCSAYCIGYAAGAFAQPVTSEKQPITAEKLRPPANLLLDCNNAPSGAVTVLPPKLARWATIYCTKIGHIFAYRDGYFATFPGSGVRAVINAAEVSGRRGEVGHEAYFTHVEYRELSPAERARLTAESGAEEQRLGDPSKALVWLALRTNSGHEVSMIVSDPEGDPFWVFPIRDGKVGKVGFYVVSLAFLNKKN